MLKPISVSHLTLVRARAGCTLQLGECLSQLLEPSRQSPGCMHFELQHSQSDPRLWQVAGYWRDEVSMMAFFNSPAMQVFSQLVSQQMVDSLEFKTFSDASPRRMAK